MAAKTNTPREASRCEVSDTPTLTQPPTETTYRHDDVGHLIKRNVINALSCRYDGVEVFRADLSSGISANPYVQFYTVAEASGDLEFTWIDDEGERGSERQAIVVRG